MPENVHLCACESVHEYISHYARSEILKINLETVRFLPAFWMVDIRCAMVMTDRPFITLSKASLTWYSLAESNALQ